MKRPREPVQVSGSEADVTGDADLYKLLPRALIQANPFLFPRIKLTVTLFLSDLRRGTKSRTSLRIAKIGKVRARISCLWVACFTLAWPELKHARAHIHKHAHDVTNRSLRPAASGRLDASR